MAYFAQFDESNVVATVLVVSDTVAPNEAAGIAWLKSSYGESTNWAQTWMDANGASAKRYNYAGIGYTWDAVNEAFISPKPFPSWSLDDDFQWQAPTPMPDDGKAYVWDEAAQEWVEFPAG